MPNEMNKLFYIVSLLFFSLFKNTSYADLPTNLLELPESACTFYSSTYANQFDSCADYSAEVGRNGCTIHKVFFSYPGIDVQMWLPDYFIEVTKYAGKSMFATPGNALEKGLLAHLSLANIYFSGAEMGANSITDGPADNNMDQMSYWQVRLVQNPYGREAMNFEPNFAPVGSGLPIYFDGISEFVSQQWRDNLADLPFAALWAPISVPICIGSGAIQGITNEIQGKLSSAKGTFPSTAPPKPSLPFGVAVPMTGKEIFAQNLLPSSDVFAPFTNPLKLCAGTKGPLLPRTGLIPIEDRYQSAAIAAVKFLSLIGDAYPWGQGYKLNDDDKFQLVYPKSPGFCFLPKGIIDSNFVETRSVISENSPPESNTYIFAFWRRRNSCQDRFPTKDYYINPSKQDSYHSHFVANKILCGSVSGFK